MALSTDYGGYLIWSERLSSYLTSGEFDLVVTAHEPTGVYHESWARNLSATHADMNTDLDIFLWDEATDSVDVVTVACAGGGPAFAANDRSHTFDEPYGRENRANRRLDAGQ